MRCRYSSASGGYGLLAPSDRAVICSAKPLRSYLLADFIKRYINKLILYIIIFTLTNRIITLNLHLTLVFISQSSQEGILEKASVFISSLSFFSLPKHPMRTPLWVEQARDQSSSEILWGVNLSQFSATPPGNNSLKINIY